MNKENTEKLFNDFPEFFNSRNEGLMASLMSFGFECHDGWFDLIYNLCSDIKDWYMNNESRHYDENYENYEVKKGIQPHFQVQQVKEKFGTLRFYIGFAPKAIHDLIRKAENDSYFICERCGDDVRTHEFDGYHSYYRDDLGWVQTLCDKCLKKEIERVGLVDGDYVSDWQKKHNAPFVRG